MNYKRFWGRSLLMAALLSGSLAIHAQSVTYQFKDVPLETVLKEVERQSDYSIIYKKDVLDGKKRVTADFKNASPAEVLSQVLGNDVTFSIQGKMILIAKKGENALRQSGKKQTVTGVITDANGEPLIGANVTEKGTTNGTITDIDGKFTLTVPAGSMLAVSYIGYSGKEVRLKPEQSTLSIVLNEDNEMLEEVVVVGYGSMRKKDLTGAIAQVKPTNMMKEGVFNVEDLLRTGVPGLSVGLSSSAKGGGSYQIRGQRSLNGDNSPLIVVDDMIFTGDMSEINPQDIAQIDVLKDASSAAIYGSQSANGVIIITTKKGKEGKPVVNFNANFGVITQNYKRKYYDAEGYLNFRSDWYDSKDGFTNPGKYKQPTPENLEKYGMSIEEWRAMSSDTGTDDEIWLNRLGLFPQEIENYLAGRTYDWYDEVFRTGFKQDYNASISGAGEKVNYYFSLGYLDSKSQAIGDDFKTIRANFKLEATAADFLTLGLNLNFQHRDESGLPSSSTYIRDNSPYALPYDEEGNLVLYPMGENPLNSGSNYRFDMQYRSNEEGTTVLLPVLTAKVKLPFDIQYSFNFSPRMQWDYERYHESSEHPLWQDTHNGYVSRTNQSGLRWRLNNRIFWEHTFAQKHKVNVTLVQEAEKLKTWSDEIEARDFTPTDALGFHNVTGSNKTRSDYNVNDTQRTADAYLGRLFYSYANKYMATYSIRRDGNSAFGIANPRATFMSAALAWTFTEEDFFRWEPMNYGKLRASWGSNGNNGVDTYDAVSDLTTGSGSYIYVLPDGTLKEVAQLFASRMANPNLKWERTTSWNFGIDFGFFDNRINGSIEYYHMPTTDLIMSQSLSNITGFTSITSNLGEVLNKGFELTLNTLNMQRENFEWRSGFGFSLNRNKIVHLYYTYEDILDEQGNVIGSKERDDKTNGWFIGKDINEIWNYQYEGIWQIGEEEEAAKYGQVPGDPKFKDIYDIESRRYSDEDKVFLGSTSPKFTWTFRNDFTLWKDLTLSVNIYSKWGHRGSEEFIQTGVYPERRNVLESKYWTPNNPTNNYARLGATNVATGGERIIDKSFIRLENIALEYSVPKTFLKKYHINGLRLSCGVRNIACWTKEWQYADPEFGNVVPVTFNFGIGLTL